MRERIANTAPANRHGGVVLRQMLAILVASAALGWVYNKTSPLGVRAPKPGGGRGAPLPPTNTVSLNPVPTAPVAFNPTAHEPPPAVSNANAVAPAPNPRGGLRWVEVKPLLEAGRIVLVDARARTAFEAEHIPGAVSLPANAPAEEFVAFAMKYPQTTPIVVYCGGTDCDLSHQLAEKLRGDLGYSDVREMPGGIVEWRLAEAKAGAATSR